MPEGELMRSLGRLIRGLSGLFWGLPVSLIVCFHTARSDLLWPFGWLPPLVCNGWLLYSLLQLGSFQKQERVWQRALDRAGILALVNFGLSPFLFWYNRMPGHPLFATMIMVLCVTGVLFLGMVNFVLQRLGAMLPDEALRSETRQFTLLNLNLLLAMLILGLGYLTISQVMGLPEVVSLLPICRDSTQLVIIPLCFCRWQ
jgi:hypothetical protein